MRYFDYCSREYSDVLWCFKQEVNIHFQLILISGTFLCSYYSVKFRTLLLITYILFLQRRQKAANNHKLAMKAVKQHLDELIEKNRTEAN